jgi:conjugal transfer pilus assembly protein TraK
MRNLSLILFITSTIIVNAAYALQTKPVKDNQTVFVKISSTEPSRIFVSGDRISKTRGMDGVYDLKKDDSLGEVFIQPSPSFQHKPFNLFVTTEQGHHYTLLLNPMGIPAETIELKPLSPSALLASRWERSSPYSDVLINLMHDMTNNNKPEGYAVIDLGKVKPKKLDNCLTMQLLTIYRGNHLQGEIWKLKNDGRGTIRLNPRQFYVDDARALSLNDESLDAGAETLLYRVVSHGE